MNVMLVPIKQEDGWNQLLIWMQWQDTWLYRDHLVIP